MMRNALLQLEKELSRRTFLGGLLKGFGLVAAFDRLGTLYLGAKPDSGRSLLVADADIATRVYSRIGDIIIPVDEDPGWITFEPQISEYGLRIFTGQVLLNGNAFALDGLFGALNFFNDAPPTVDYGPNFLDMAPSAQVQYLSAILAGEFEKGGLHDILGFALLFALVSTKAVFFSNFPYHLAQDSEFQILPANKPKTGWDIMGWKGPVGPEEEKALRARFFDAEVLPGVDLENPFL